MLYVDEISFFVHYFFWLIVQAAVQSATFGQGRVCSLLFLSTSHEVVWYHYFVVYMSSLTPLLPSHRPFPVIVIPLPTYNTRIASSPPLFVPAWAEPPPTSHLVLYLTLSPLPRALADRGFVVIIESTNFVLLVGWRT